MTHQDGRAAPSPTKADRALVSTGRTGTRKGEASALGGLTVLSGEQKYTSELEQGT